MVAGTLRLRHTGLALAVLAFMTACGGGSGGGVRPTPPPVDPPPTAPPPDPVVSTPDPDLSKHILLTHADVAHDAGYTGEGIRIGVIDTGVNRDHPALSPRVVENLVYIGSNNDLSVDDVVGHGTAVSQVMAGTPFGAWPGGIAPGAEIVSARIISDDPPEDDGSGQGNELEGPLGIEPIHADMIALGVRIINNSWGGLYWTKPEVTAMVADEYREFIIDNDGLVVFSTGNEGFANPSDTAALPSQPGPNSTMPAADLEQGWLAVAALNSDNPTQLASYSNACGLAMNYCIVAPGDVVTTGTDDAPDNPKYWEWQGTSFSAPIISGAAAVVWDAFPYFNNDMVRQTLLGTATDLGAPGVDAVFGYGLVDLAKAIKGPAQLNWGQVEVAIEGDSTWSNDISGAGGITKDGAGLLQLTGANSYTGETIVTEGALVVSDHALPGDARIESFGVLGLDATSVQGSVFNDGILSIGGGDAAGVEHTIAGSLTFGTDAYLDIEIGSSLQVDGQALLDGHLNVNGVAPGYVYQTIENIIHADGGVSGQFDDLSASENVFLDAIMHYDADDMWLEITRLDVTATAQSTGMQATAVGSALRVESAFDLLDQALQQPLATTSLTGNGEFKTAAAAFQRIDNVAAAERSLDSLSGELHQAGTALSLMAIENNRHALESRFDRLQGATKTGAWFESLDGQRGASQHMDFNSQGWVIGQDFRLANGATVGAAFSESRGYGRNDARADSEHSRQVEGELYAAWEIGDSYLLGRFALGRSERDLERQILLGAQAFDVDSRYAQRYSTTSLQFGHRLRSGNGMLTPYVGAQALQLQRDGFSEQGAAGFGLSTRDSTLSASQAIAGLRFDQQWSTGATQWTLQGRAEYQHTLSQSGEGIDARFTAIDAWSPIAGGALGDEVGVFGLGLEAAFIGGSRLGFGVDSRHADGRDYMQARLQWTAGF